MSDAEIQIGEKRIEVTIGGPAGPAGPDTANALLAFTGASGSDMVGFSQSSSYAAGTLGKKLKQVVCVDDAPYYATGDGVTNDTAAIQSAIDAMSALYLADGKPRTLNYSAGKTYVVRNLKHKPGVNHIGPSSTLLKTPAGVVTDEAVLKYWRILDTDYPSFATAAACSHRIIVEGLIFDGNLANMNWTDGTYNQEQGHCLYLSGAAAPASASVRAKFHVRNVEFRNSVADGLSQGINSDVIAENIRANDCFRGGLVSTGGNSILRADGYAGENARVDTEVDGAGYGGSMRLDATLDRIDVDLVTGGGRWTGKGGIDLGATSGGRLHANAIRTYSAPFNYDATGGGDRRFTDCRFTLGNDTGSANRLAHPESGVFKDCHFYVKRVSGALAYTAIRIYPLAAPSGAVAPLRFERCKLELDPAIKANEPAAVCKAFAMVPHDPTLTYSYVAKECEQIGLWDIGYAVEQGGTLTIDGGVHTAVEAFRTVSSTGFPAKVTIRGHHVMQPTVTRLFENVGQGAVTGATKNYDKMSLSRAVGAGSGNDTFYTVTGDGYSFPVTTRPSFGATRGARAVLNPAGLNLTTQITVLEWVAINTHYNDATFRPVRWVTNKGTTAARPALGADDIGVTYLDTTLVAAGKLITWTGSSWVDGTGTTV